MTIYFAFSDESGQYQENRTEIYNRLYPYYVRATLIIDGDSWFYLDSRFRELKEDYQIPHNTEIKYADVWTLYRYQQNHTRILERRLKPFDYIPHHVFEELINDSLGLLDEIQYANIILTITKNDSNARVSEVNLYKMHLQDLMQRLQMDLQTSRDPFENENWCVVFMDPISRQINRFLSDAYNEIFLNGDYIENYFVIKDCLHFELSHHSCGIQFADYIAGATLGYLQGRRFSSQLFNNRVRAYIRQCPWGKTMGCGIIDIPSNPEVRQFYSDRFQVD